MRTATLLVVLLVVLTMSVQANAARLVYTGYQDHASNPLIPDNGERVYTLAVQILPNEQGIHYTPTGQSIIDAGAIGISLIMTGISGLSPVQLPRNLSQGLAGAGTYQQTQDGLDAGLDPSSIALTRAADSFFYSSPTGQLTTEGEDGPVQVVGDPKLNAPGLSPNPYSLMWLPSNSPNSVTNVTGSTMSINAIYGDPTRELGSPVSEASYIGPGIYPLAQIVLPVGGSIIFEAGQSIGIATGGGFFFNVLGGPLSSDLAGIGAFLSYDANAYLTNTRAIRPIGAASAVPEPGSLVLAALGFVLLLPGQFRGVVSRFGRSPGKALVLIVFSLWRLTSVASAATLHSGDIVLSATITSTGGDGLLQIDGATGDRTILSDATHGAGPLFVFDTTGTFSSSITRVSDGRLLVAARNGIFYVDPTSGDRTMLTPNFASDLVSVGDELYAVNYVGLYRIDPVTGATNLLSFDGHGNSVALMNGNLFIGDTSIRSFNLNGQQLSQFNFGPLVQALIPYASNQLIVGSSNSAAVLDFEIYVGNVGNAGISFETATGLGPNGTILRAKGYAPNGTFQLASYQVHSDPSAPQSFTVISSGGVGAGPGFAVPHGMYVVPEPSAIVLSALGILGFAFFKLRR